MDLLAGLLSLRDLLDKDKLQRYADSLPTAEENLNTVKQGAMGLLSKAQTGASGLRDQAMQAYQSYMNPPQAPGPIDPAITARFEQRQRGELEQMAAAMRPPEQPRYLHPDQSGRMASRPELEMFYEMQRDRFNDQYLPQASPQPMAAPAAAAPSMPQPSPRVGNYPAPMPTGTRQMSVRDNFNQAYAAAKAQGLKVFPWTNPATGQQQLYAVE